MVCTRNRPEYLHQCLAAVSQLHYSNFEILVVDNAPSDERTRDVAQRWGARYVVEPVVGLSRARNCGAAHSRTDLIAYLDDDSLPKPDWLSALAVEFSDFRVMGAAGRICAPPAPSEELHFIEAIQGNGEINGSRKLFDRETPGWFELSNFGGIGAGGNMAFRRSAFEVWPGFDPRLGRGAVVDSSEDNYAFFSLVERGYRVAYSPDAVVVHPTRRTAEEYRSRYLKDCAVSIGYLTLLLIEQPKYRGLVLKYIVAGLSGRRRSWRGPLTYPNALLAPTWRVMMARLSGPLLYARLRLQNGRRVTS